MLYLWVCDVARHLVINRIMSNFFCADSVDKDLTKGLKRLLGRESVLLDAYNATPESNLTAWVTAQVPLFTSHC